MQIDLHGTLRAVMRADSPAVLAQIITRQVAASGTVVLARIWFLADRGLTLAASAGTPSGGGSYMRLDGEFREMAVADVKIQEIAVSREPLVVRGLRGDEEWLTNPAWTARQGVRAFLALPLAVDDTVVGLLAIFDREMPTDDLLSQLQLIADIAAARLVTSVPASDLRPSQEGRRSLITRAELRRIERESIEAALAKTQGKVFGVNGAAAMLGMRPTTLASRIKALGIARS